jgi:hypothetical protein
MMSPITSTCTVSPLVARRGDCHALLLERIDECRDLSSAHAQRDSVTCHRQTQEKPANERVGSLARRAHVSRGRVTPRRVREAESVVTRD